MGVLGVERRDLGSPPVEITRLVHLVPHGSDPFGVTHRLAVWGGVSFAVEIAPTQLFRCQSQQRRAAAEDVLDHDHPLRTAEAAERGVGGLVGFGDPTVDPDVRNPVRIVDMAQCPGQHRLGQVETPAAIGGQGGLESHESAVVVEADPPLGVEAVPLARHREVLGAAEA